MMVFGCGKPICQATVPFFPQANHFSVFRQNLTSINITGTSMSTPTTVARAAPEERPNSMVAVAMAT